MSTVLLAFHEELPFQVLEPTTKSCGDPTSSDALLDERFLLAGEFV